MKKSLILSGAFALALAAPSVFAEPAAEAVAPVVQPAAPSQADVELAVKRYMFNTAAKGLEIVAEGTANSDGSPMSQAKLLVGTLSVLQGSDMSELPEYCQAFISESVEAAKPLLEEMLQLIEDAQSGKIDETQFTLSLMDVAKKSQEVTAAVEAKHPEAAAVMGQEATQRMTMELMPVLQKMAEPRIRAHFAEHPEDAMDQKKILSVSLKVIAELFREMSAEL